ncbi:hypothetical protein [Arthrobacter sp. B1I2]|uniref:hypothetical protein n=1 Tax=Arthrobacter sp. B1I2 TaxID=3042263 RepID=UPI00277EB158|nr:hypothetical protein [Arthrobacter sp. B1I2]MDQ0732235.1 hypothetical protein [Arthrobacter sp. B1I2]
MTEALANQFRQGNAHPYRTNAGAFGAKHQGEFVHAAGCDGVDSRTNTGGETTV